MSLRKTEFSGGGGVSLFSLMHYHVDSPGTCRQVVTFGLCIS